MNSKLRFKQILQWYLKKEISKEELIEFINSIENEDNLIEMKSQLENVWNEEFQEDVEVDWEQMLNRIKSSEDYNEQRNTLNPWKKWLIAATVAGVLFGGYWGYKEIIVNDFQEKSIVKNDKNLKNDTAVLDNKKQTIHLPDGSTVVLNSNSTLSYPKTFSDSSRVVKLIGEAFFDIKRNENKPFKVITGDIVTTVLGTSFNIKAYKTDEAIAVSVISGKVKVSNSEKTLATLEPNNQLIIDKENNSTERKTIDAKETIAWTPVDVKLENKTLSEVVENISNVYGVEFIFLDEKAKKCLMTISFSTEDSFEEVMMVISKLLRLEYYIDKTKIYIKSSAC